MIIFLIFMWLVGFIDWKQLLIIGLFQILLDLYNKMKESGNYEN